MSYVSIRVQQQGFLFVRNRILAFSWNFFRFLCLILLHRRHSLTLNFEQALFFFNVISERFHDIVVVLFLQKHFAKRRMQVHKGDMFYTKSQFSPSPMLLFSVIVV
jgi:hypothetical protein